MNKIKPFYKLTLLSVILITCLLVSLTPVQASSGGNQLKITACAAVRVVIQGKNPAGKTVSYTLNKAASNCDPIKIADKWWQGTVSITAYYNVTPEYPAYNGQSLAASVPTQAQTNSYYAVSVPTPTARQWIVWRAQTWVTDHVAYNQSSTHDGYRQDCSGYVSFAWQIKKPGTSPSGISAYAHTISFDSLQPGDALNNASAHTMLFVKWVDKSKGTFIADDEENPSSGTRQRTLTLNKSTGVITQNIYYSYPGKYVAMRLNGL